MAEWYDDTYVPTSPDAGYVQPAQWDYPTYPSEVTPIWVDDTYVPTVPSPDYTQPINYPVYPVTTPTPAGVGIGAGAGVVIQPFPPAITITPPTPPLPPITLPEIKPAGILGDLFQGITGIDPQTLMIVILMMMMNRRN